MHTKYIYSFLQHGHPKRYRTPGDTSVARTTRGADATAGGSAAGAGCCVGRYTAIALPAPSTVGARAGGRVRAAEHDGQGGRETGAADRQQQPLWGGGERVPSAKRPRRCPEAPQARP